MHGANIAAYTAGNVGTALTLAADKFQDSFTILMGTNMTLATDRTMLICNTMVKFA